MADVAPEKLMQRRSWTSRFTTTSRILLFWYTLVTITFRCPSSPVNVTDDSPWMCKPYFELRDQATPYIQPYYDAYAAPYVETFVTPYIATYIKPHVEKVRPYAENLQSKVYLPIRQRAARNYNKYGATQVSQVLDYFDSEWERKIKPYIDQYMAEAQAQYRTHIQPYASKVADPIRPRAIQAQIVIMDQYHKIVIPLYERSIPIFLKIYSQFHRVVVNVGYPYSLWTAKQVTGVITRKIWPAIRVLYGRNVEPQLSRISERLSSYWDAKRLEVEVGAVDTQEEHTPSSSEAFTSTPTNDSISAYTATSGTFTSTFAEADTSTTTSTIPQHQEVKQAIETQGLIESVTSMMTATAEPPSRPSTAVPETLGEATPTGSTTAEKITGDLKRWQTKFKLAADKGADDLGERVSQITKRQIEGQVRSVGDTLVLQLEDASKDAVEQLKAAINKAVHGLPEDASDEVKESSVEDVRTAIRSAGRNLKNRAQDLRSWKAQFDVNLDALVDAASRSTLNVIDGIRDLGLQEIGLRWASMDHVTYQDWTEYHNLKETFDEWREQVLKVALDHEGLVAAKHEADEIESRGMGIAENAAKELAQLKEVARWKIHAQDTSDDFNTRGLPAAAARLGQKILDKITGVASASNTKSNPATTVFETADTAEDTESRTADTTAETSQSIPDHSMESVSLTHHIEGQSATDSFSTGVSTIRAPLTEASASFTEAMAGLMGSVRGTSDVEHQPGLSGDSISYEAQQILSDIPRSISSQYDVSATVSAEVSSATQNAGIVSPLSSALSLMDKSSETIKDYIPTSSSTETIVDTIISQVASSASNFASKLKSQFYAGVDAVKEQVHISNPISTIISELPSESLYAKDIAESATTPTSVISSATWGVSATIAPSMGGIGEDVVDNIYAASRSLQSRLSEAGENYAEVTNKMAYA